MARTKSAKPPANNRYNKKQKLGLNPEKFNSQSQQKQKTPIKSKPTKNPSSFQDEDPILFGSAAGADESESESESDSPSEPASPTRIQSALEQYTKPQLLEFLLDAAPSDPNLRARIRALADADVSRRHIFVVGFARDVTKENIVEVFSSFGPIEDCHAVVDNATGHGKGYGFVLFRARSGAANALKVPHKWMGRRLITCQMASVSRQKSDIRGRKIYIGNVPPNVQPEMLREFFAKFGKIESGVIGFDGVTVKPRGHALFVYKTQEDAKKALEEPHKMFDGHQLYCKLAVPSIGELQKVAAPVSHVQTVNAAAAQAVVPQLRMFTTLNPSSVNAAALGGVAGVPYGGGAQSMLGAYGTGQVSGAIGLPGLQGYQASSYSEGGQSSGKAGGDFHGYKASNLW